MHQTESVPIDFAPALVNVEKTADGGFILSSPMPLEAYEESLGVLLRRWAAQTPDTVFLGERGPSGAWHTLTYREAAFQADSIAQALLDRNLGPDRPVMILSGNSIRHALIMLGCFLAGVPVASISAAYSLLSDDFFKLKVIFTDVKPALIYAEDGTMFSRALHA
ncbi:MAG: AMP-binding protein, partial [Desulfuromonadaceae bacterium]